MIDVEKENTYLQDLLKSYTGTAHPELQIINPNKLKKSHVFTLGYLIERMQQNDFGNDLRLEQIRIHVLSALMSTGDNVVHKEEIRDNLDLRVEKASDPEYPGVYVFVMNTRNDSEREVGTVLVEMTEDNVVARVWDYENQGQDPVSIELYKYRE